MRPDRAPNSDCISSAASPDACFWWVTRDCAAPLVDTVPALVLSVVASLTSQCCDDVAAACRRREKSRCDAAVSTDDIVCARVASPLPPPLAQAHDSCQRESCLKVARIDRKLGASSPGCGACSAALTVNASLLVGLGNGPIENGPLEEHHLLKAIVRAMRQPALTEILHAVTDIFTASTTFSSNQHTMRHHVMMT